MLRIFFSNKIFRNNENVYVQLQCSVACILIVVDPLMTYSKSLSAHIFYFHIQIYLLDHEVLLVFYGLECFACGPAFVFHLSDYANKLNFPTESISICVDLGSWYNNMRIINTHVKIIIIILVRTNGHHFNNRSVRDITNEQTHIYRLTFDCIFVYNKQSSN